MARQRMHNRQIRTARASYMPTPKGFSVASDVEVRAPDGSRRRQPALTEEEMAELERAEREERRTSRSTGA